METREILGIILAVAAVILVIGVLSIVRKGAAAKAEQSESVVETTPPPPVTEAPSIWEQIRNQQTTVTEEAAAEQTDVTAGTESEEGTAPADNGETITEAIVTDEAGVELPAAVTGAGQDQSEDHEITMPESAPAGEPYTFVIELP